MDVIYSVLYLVVFFGCVVFGMVVLYSCWSLLNSFCWFFFELVVWFFWVWVWKIRELFCLEKYLDFLILVCSSLGSLDSSCGIGYVVVVFVFVLFR